MKNEILDEVWRIRDDFARRHNYNLEAMVAELRKMERNPLNILVDRSGPTPNQANAADARIRAAD
jgi:hypothetical protein